jgi:VWFA-related protein
MISRFSHKKASQLGRMMCLAFSVVFAATILLSGNVLAQDQQTDQQTSQQPSNTNQQEAPPPAGGPDDNANPYAIPKKKEAPPEPPPEVPKKIEGMPNYSINVTVPEVDIPVLVTTKDGQFIPHLKKGNFKVYEDGVEQNISNFSETQDAPITAVLLMEFAQTNYFFLHDTLVASYAFANGLKKNDWVAVEYYDMKPHILVDFTQNKQAVYGAISQMTMPMWQETNLFDALYDALDRLQNVEGHKYIILVSTGIDSFSKLRLDEILKKVKASQDVTIFPVDIGWYIREMCEVQHCTGQLQQRAGLPLSRIDYEQADNEMNTFARLTGGRAYFPRFQAEFPEIMHDILGDIRSQYNLAYHPTNAKQDGSYRKLKVEVVGPDDKPLKVTDQKGKNVKYQIIAKEGYTARHTVE